MITLHVFALFRETQVDLSPVTTMVCGWSLVSAPGAMTSVLMAIPPSTLACLNTVSGYEVLSE